MAVDEVLLSWAAETGGCCWRLYAWEEPTLSLGYFQAYRDRRGHIASRDCPAVRRLTGGGAIVHDAELTYSLVVPAEHPLAVCRDRLYETVHASLIETLAEWGITARLCERAASGETAPDPFLCFQRRAPGDVLVGETKIAGSAQRRRRGAVLQHGSVLLDRSPAAPELASLADVSATGISPGALAGAWQPRLAERLRTTWDQRWLTPAERLRALDLAETCYSRLGWTEDRRRRVSVGTRPNGGKNRFDSVAKKC